ncbi:MAG: hypothetical protein A2259_02250 [Candidatus Moranbacteria bacterium RIFOXYA2_FULL_43_15]|nr:MAG: hypothetical protein A2259_02250 [Candidatus Moranbacteria bacterium RIFOXYA2_FULL_43_15]
MWEDTIVDAIEFYNRRPKYIRDFPEFPLREKGDKFIPLGVFRGGDDCGVAFASPLAVLPGRR